MLPHILENLARQLLFICSQNCWRSPTTEQPFEGHLLVAARSAGTEAGARVRVTAGYLGWADVVFIMEKRHAERLREKFADTLAGKSIINLRIPDRYQLNDPTLVELLRSKLAAYLS